MEDKVTQGGRTRRATAAKAAAPAATKPAATRPASAARKAAAPAKAAATRKAVASPADAPATGNGPDRVELIRLAAYFRAERRGFAPGYEVDDWLAAEADVAVELGVAPTAARKTPSRKARPA